MASLVAMPRPNLVFVLQHFNFISSNRAALAFGKTSRTLFGQIKIQATEKFQGLPERW
jgi:hypothetical protein